MDTTITPHSDQPSCYNVGSATDADDKENPEAVAIIEAIGYDRAVVAVAIEAYVSLPGVLGIEKRQIFP